MARFPLPLGQAFVCALAAALVLGLAAAPAAGAQPRPNIVLVLTDDQRWDTLERMPTVQEELVGKGVTFANAFAADPLCCPSRATILTGLHAHSTRVYRNEPPLGGYRSFDASSTIATWLDQAGYRTGYFGRYLNGYDEPDVPPGWHRWLASAKGYVDFLASDDGVHVEFGSTPDDYSTDVYAAEAAAFIEADEERPFFVLYAPYAPHYPATPASRHVGTFADLPPFRPGSYNEQNVSDKPRWVHRFPRLGAADRAKVDSLVQRMTESLLAVDDGLRRILDTLKDSGRLENTLVVYTSDNGLLWGEHRIPGRKIAPYEESIRVPLVVRYDALGHGTRVERRLATNLDFAPTFALLAGAGPRRTEGRDLLPVVRGDSPTPWRKKVLIEHLRGTRGNPREVPTYCGVRSARWKYVVYRTQEEELYDLVSDPGELRNVAASPARRARVLALRRDVRRLCDPPPPGLSLTWLCTHETTALRRAAVGTERADTLCGSAGRDLLSGRGGGDLLRGRDGADRLRGGTGADRLEGGAGPDRLEGGPGRDVVIGGRGHDRLSGGSGADTLLARDWERDAIACGPGRDTVYADALDAVARDCEEVRRPPRTTPP